jgi:thymidine phosphorylase
MGDRVQEGEALARIRARQAAPEVAAAAAAAYGIADRPPSETPIVLESVNA